ncbi:hypothetical protein AB4571_02270 [Vibrio breoganii]|uniref:hypothetical protein n=2 Tax=Vibrio TaxID=662 RepID=UPI000C8322C2|nr:hypothetical protein [Vibrio breoganii]PML12739.1 hypothetical protein BCT84_02320 [Vibrio breoganii]
MIKKLFLVSAIAAAVSGCGALKTYDEVNEHARLSGVEVLEVVEATEYSKVFTMDRPPMLTAKLIEESEPEWLSESVDLIAEQFPLNLVLRDVLGDDIRIRYGHGVDPTTPVSIYFEGTAKEALNILSVSSNYGIDYTGELVTVDNEVIRTFFIPAVAGTMSYQLGSSGAGSSGGGDAMLSGNVSTTGSGDGQYSSIGADNYSAIEHIRTGVEALLVGRSSDGQAIEEGSVEIAPLLNSIVVKTNPRLMAQIEKYIAESVVELEREAILEIAVVEYVSDGSSEIGAELEAVLNTGGFVGGITALAPNLGTSLYGEGLNLGSSKGGSAGTSALIRYLSKSGQVSVRTTQRVKASNYQVQEIDMSESQEYISETEVTYASDSAAYPTTSISKSTVRDGVKMLANVTIKEDDIYLRLTGVLSKFLRFDEVAIESVTIKSPQVRQARFNTSGKYKFNETIVVTHMRQESVTTSEAKFAETTTGKASSKKVIDTLVLVTPRREMVTH